MDNINKFQDYIHGLKKTGLQKGDMIDFICGIFSNMATRNDCLAFCLKYIKPNNPEKIINEADFRRMLRKSEDKVIRELYAIAQQRYLHVSRYPDDQLDRTDKTLTQIAKEKKIKKELKKELKNENFDTQNLGLNNNTNINVQQFSSDLVNKLSDIEVHLKDLVSTNQIKLNQDQFDAISKLENIKESEFLSNLNQIFETLKTIDNNKTKLLVMNANMYLGKLIKESNGL